MQFYDKSGNTHRTYRGAVVANFFGFIRRKIGIKKTGVPIYDDINSPDEIPDDIEDDTYIIIGPSDEMIDGEEVERVVDQDKQLETSHDTEDSKPDEHVDEVPMGWDYIDNAVQE